MVDVGVGDGPRVGVAVLVGVGVNVGVLVGVAVGVGVLVFVGVGVMVGVEVLVGYGVAGVPTIVTFLMIVREVLAEMGNGGRLTSGKIGWYGAVICTTIRSAAWTKSGSRDSQELANTVVSGP